MRKRTNTFGTAVLRIAFVFLMYVYGRVVGQLHDPDLANKLASVALVTYGIGEFYFWAVDASGMGLCETLREAQRRRKERASGDGRSEGYSTHTRAMRSWFGRSRLTDLSREPVPAVQPRSDRSDDHPTDPTEVDSRSLARDGRAVVIPIDRHRSVGSRPDRGS